MSLQALCRVCDSKGLEPVLDLGTTPLADRLLSEEQLNSPEPTYPLEVVFCPKCSLVQILETVSPEELFSEDYPYYSSFSPALLRHSLDNVMNVLDRRDLSQDCLVVELASNDGYLLKNYVEKGISVLGIDPALGPAEAARKIGVPTLGAFFGLPLARELVAEGKQADVIHANNVLAHVADTNGFVQGIAELLKEDGVAVIEVPYVKELIDHCEFDTIYHEHLCYFSVTALDYLFRQHDLFLNDVEELSIHGGSLRLYVEKVEHRSPEFERLLALETKLGIDQLSYYQDFSKRVVDVKRQLVEMLTSIKQQGKSIVAYGAAAKGATLINYAGIDTETIDFVVDRNVHKQGKFMPGKHLPIAAPERILEVMPDFVLILPWNFTDEILEQQAEYRSKGGKFIVPIPEPSVI